MAKLKVTEVSGRVNTGNVVRTSQLALPMSLATAQATGFQIFGKALTDIYTSQKAEEDNNEAIDIQNKINFDVLKSFNENSKHTNLQIALENFTQDIDYNNYKDEGSNKAVKKKIRKYLSDVNTKYSLDLGKEVLKNSTAKSKFNKETQLNTWVKDISGPDQTAAVISGRLYNSFFNDPLNLAFYGPDKLAELKKQKDELILELHFINGGRKGEIDLFDNETRKAILENAPKGRAKSIIASIRNSDISLQLEEEQNIEFRDKQDKQSKITTFTASLVAMNDHRLNPSEESFNKIPSIDDLYDLKQAGALNTAQYNTLIKFHADRGTSLSDPAIEEIVNSQLALAETVEDLDALQESANLDADIVSRLNPESIIKLNGLIDKYKENRTFAQDHKKFTELLKINTKKITDAKGMIDLSNLLGKGAKDYDFLVAANSRMDEFNDLVLNKNFSPEQAYEKVISNLKENELPELHDLQQPSSININDFKENLNAHPKNTFIDMRDAVAVAYKESGNLQQYKDDLKHIDRIEDVFGVRVSLFGTTEGALGKIFGIKKEKE